MDYLKVEPNLKAQYIRHSRVFLRSILFSRGIFRLILDLQVFIKRLKWPLLRKRVFLPKMLVNQPIIVKDPFSKFLKQTVVIGIALLVVTSIAPSRILETGFTADAFADIETDFLNEEDELVLPPFLMNEEGFVLKTSPASEEVSRIGLTDSVKHTVVPGDTLSGIAALYGISVKTLVWENGISEGAPLKIGQTLVIPAIDGISHVAQKNESLASIAKSYGVQASLIKEHNNLDIDTIQKGQKLFIPGGKKKENPVIIRFATRSGSRTAMNTFDRKIVMSSNAIPEGGKKLVFPTVGRITQGFRGGHYALDIANPSKPDVWAAAPGTVVTSRGGCHPREQHLDRSCGGGYGNYVVIDHGNGLQTLYSHLETSYVSEGQNVDRGQAIGKMGNSGRTYGQTGIHVHFEVFDNGVKRNPSNYF